MKLTDLVSLIPPTPKSIKVLAQHSWTAKLGRAEATGHDADTAVKALRQMIERAFHGNYTPFTLIFRGHLGLISRTPEHWAYSIIPPQKLQEQEGRITRQWSSSLFDTEEEARKALRSHMAQYAWDGEEEQSPLIEDTEDQQQFTHHCRWQKRYKELAATGMNDAAIRDQLMMERL